jgi:integrase
MRWSHIEHDADGQWLMVHAQQKTGEAVPIPLHKDLRVALAKHGGRHKSEFILTTVTGRRYDPVRLSKDIRRRLIEIGEPPGRFTVHGLRKARVVRMAERGATVEMLMSAFGWRSSQMALFYAREASKRRLNAAAWSLVESAA